MNGSNSLQETDRGPIHLCPVCQDKLRLALGFDPAARHRRLMAFYREQGFPDEAAFAERQITPGPTLMAITEADDARLRPLIRITLPLPDFRLSPPP